MRAIVFSIFFLFCLPITSSLASYSNVDNSIKIIYNKFYIKVSNKYKNDR
ncbi:MAG: hypothetical protein P1U46_04890 [Patescibacteria group bacterium]|nr:hypothetical protein [Patescibacteria group bacterium]